VLAVPFEVLQVDTSLTETAAYLVGASVKKRKKVLKHLLSVAAATSELAMEVAEAIRRYVVEPDFDEHCPI